MDLQSNNAMLKNKHMSKSDRSLNQQEELSKFHGVKNKHHFIHPQWESEKKTWRRKTDIGDVDSMLYGWI